MFVSEHVAIKTDDDWSKGTAKIIRTLTPRETDSGKKSSWAHYSVDDSTPTEDVLADLTLAPRILHALTMLFWSECRRKIGDAPRNSIRGVSIPREALAGVAIESDWQPHLLPAYSALHRSLFTGDAGLVGRVAQEMAEKGAYEPWRYTRQDLANVLRLLLELKVVAQDLEADARSLLAQWDA